MPKEPCSKAEQLALSRNATGVETAKAAKCKSLWQARDQRKLFIHRVRTCQSRPFALLSL